jgi:hypothetical protein
VFKKRNISFFQPEFIHAKKGLKNNSRKCHDLFIITIFRLLERKSLYANVFSLEIFPRHNNFSRFYGTHIQQCDSTDGTNWVSSSRQQFKRLPVIFFEFIGKNYIFYHHLREPGKSKTLAPFPFYASA